MRSQVDSLREQLVDYEQAKYKNEFYQEFLGLKEEHSDYVFAEAAVIGRDAAGRFGTVTLNKGSINDIRVNDPVIYGEYLVGVVASVTPTQCTVNTILNRMSVSAYEVRTRDLGFVTSTVELAEQGAAICRVSPPPPPSRRAASSAPRALAAFSRGIL